MFVGTASFLPRWGRIPTVRPGAMPPASGTSEIVTSDGSMPDIDAKVSSIAASGSSRPSPRVRHSGTSPTKMFVTPGRMGA